MKRRSVTRALIGVAIVVLGLMLLGKSFRKSAVDSTLSSLPPPAPLGLPGAEPALPEPSPARPEPPSPTPAPHPSLDGTDVNGGLHVDSQGRIVLHRDLRRLFDYYLSLRGRMDAESIRALLRQHLEALHPLPVVKQAMALFDRYLTLIDAETRLTEEWTARDLNATAQVEEVLAERRYLRHEYLGDDMAEAFYQDQEQYEAYQLERMKISTNPQLTPEQKKAALESAEIILSPEQREIRKKTFAWLDIKSLARQPVDSLDGEAAEAIRQRFGDDALDRLAAVEEERRTWEHKRAAWLAEKSRLAALPNLSDEERTASLLEYGRTHLDSTELRRMQALDSDTSAL
ncbi:lipase secretion chaperone [Oligoflexus tunisiensis]|uniref:lipase secretion chaperone n=1 Tax=Oligoflexus tunisiensis TaxID=708132 RepID=UPI00114CB51C|nr:lipase secretion chaperone [Oligoflexus tunisiensis]